MMKVIFVSKFYYRRAGLETYLFKAKTLLEDNNHIVIPFSTNYIENENTEYQKYFCQYYELSQINKIRLSYNLNAFVNMFFNKEAYRNVKKLCSIYKPDLLQGFGVTKHLSYSVFKAAKEAGIKTIMRLSDYALICPNSNALDGNFKECSNFDCTTNWNFKCIRLKCIQDSRLASFIGFLEAKGNLPISGYKKYVDYFIAPSKFIRNIFINQYHVHPDKIIFLPIFFDSPNPCYSHRDENYILYAGRISREKGIITLLDALSKDRSLKLKIAGKGPLEEKVKAVAKQQRLNVEFLGFQSFNKLQELIVSSSLVVVPSEWYENSPNIILEAYSVGKPVVASRIGGIPEIVFDGITGNLFEPKNSDDLLNKIHETIRDKEKLGRNAVDKIRQDFSPLKHYNNLMAIYDNVLAK